MGLFSFRFSMGRHNLSNVIECHGNSSFALWTTSVGEALVSLFLMHGMRLRRFFRPD